ANTGGALTGDTNNPLLYMGIGCTSLGLLFFLLYKNKKDTHN
ncbi:MAG: LPXTG cell wall anchor domain-containing protein, partial [Erysipelotrichaceae bacterium]|nr:LPXTG cell wall anchor domain-containing protein [Erysipelotrichaceae bacterium]